MELTVRDGDYLPDGLGGLKRAEGKEELLQRVLWKLTARRGAFPFLPELGSRLYLLPRSKPADWQLLAEQYVAEALSGEEGLTVNHVAVEPDGAGAKLTAELSWSGEDLTVSAAVEG